MRLRNMACTAAMAFVVTLSIPTRLAAQENPDNEPKHHHYKLIDLGTFGGPTSILFAASGPLNNRGKVTGCADTSVLDTNYPNINPYFGNDPYIQHAYVWQSGVRTDLGVLPGGTSSCTQWINKSGVIVGASTNGVIDPLVGTPEINAVRWGKRGTILNLGTLGGNESVAWAINDRGQVAGGALNTVPDQFTGNFFLAGATQVHAFLWEDGVMQDLGTLGGTDSVAFNINQRGQLAGIAATNNPSIGVPTIDPFFWDGKMVDLGTLGGTFGLAFNLNNRGQVVGYSNLAGDVTAHPFLWPGEDDKMQDLGTLGGCCGGANWLNDAGEIVGLANLDGDQANHAVLWRNGAIIDLGVVPGDSCDNAEGINSKSQVVGVSGVCGGPDAHAFLWENGSIVDLNTLIPPGSTLSLIDAPFINDRGEIACNGLLPSGEEHACLLIPCDENHGEVKGCDYGRLDATTAAQVRATQAAQSSTVANENHDRPMGLRDGLDRRLMHRRGFPGVRSPNK